MKSGNIALMGGFSIEGILLNSVELYYNFFCLRPFRVVVQSVIVIGLMEERERARTGQCLVPFLFFN